MTVLNDSLPRPRRSISSATFCADRCDSSRRTGSSAASRAAAAALLASAISLPAELHTARLGGLQPGAGALGDHPPFLLGQGSVNMQRKRINAATERADDERHALRHQPGNEGDVAAQPIQLGDSDFATSLLRRPQRCLQLRAPIERVRAFAGLD